MAAGPTTFALRYSAGNGNITRKIELDGAAWVANQVFPGTGNWSTWGVLTLNQSLTAGSHTLTIIFDSPSGSAGYLNLDNLTVSQADSGGGGGASVTVAAGQALTNLQTETVYPGAQDPPYICCWHSQGQYVTFAFTVAAGATTFVLGYSASNNNATRKIELDGAPWLPNQVFPATANWSTWATLTLSWPMGLPGQTLTAGTHTLTIIFDTTSGSSGYLNLDNLTVSQAGSGGGGAGSVTLAAGKAQTNLPTETVWPGAQDPPYICCWISQGQYVTFSFTVPGGPTAFALRYSAGNGPIKRKIELDGTTWVATQVFPGTGNWSTWSTLSLTQTLGAGAHTLTVIFDTASASAGYLNLDNLTVSYGGSGSSPPNVTVALGYADSATGLTPWSGSTNTIFIGEPPQCCATHGPDNGQPGYDGGAIEITNTGTTAVTVSDVSVDFGGGSSPSTFDLWGGGGTSGKLPQSLPAGWHLVLTMTSSFNFDTSDLFGEACHINSGVIPIVNITMGGAVTSYNDDHQILNSDGADLASCPGDVSEQKAFASVNPGAQPAAAAVNDVPPSVTGVAIQSRILSGFAGGWNASPPPTLSLQWTRCDSSGANCVAITGATHPTYIPAATDVGHTLRLQVTAVNATRSVVLASTPTTVVQSGPAVTQMGDTSTGFTSAYVTSTTELSSIFTAASSGTTTDFEFFARGAGGTQVFTPKVYAVSNGAKGALLATGPTITVPMGTNGQWYVSALSGLHLAAGTQYVLALDPGGTKSTYVGAETSGEMSFFVDYLP